MNPAAAIPANPEAASTGKRAIAELRAEVDADPQRLPQLIDARCALALELRRSGDLDGSAQCYRDAIEDCGTGPTEVAPEFGLRLFSLLGDVLDLAGKNEDCVHSFRTVIIFAGECRSKEAIALPLAGVHNNLGMRLAKGGELPAACEQYRLGIAALPGISPEDCACKSKQPLFRLSNALDDNLGMALLDLGNYSKARGCFSRVLARLRQAFGPGAATSEIRLAFERLDLAFRGLGDEETGEACSRLAATTT